MTFDPVLTAPVAIQIHAAAGLLAISLGPLALYSQHPARRHRAVGYAWVVSMAVLALSSFAIDDFASDRHFGLLHGLALVVLWTLWTGARAALRGDHQAHSASFRSLYWNGLLIAGALQFLPGRMVNRALFPDDPMLGWLPLVAISGALAWRILRQIGRPPLRA